MCVRLFLLLQQLGKPHTGIICFSTANQKLTYNDALKKSTGRCRTFIFIVVKKKKIFRRVKIYDDQQNPMTTYRITVIPICIYYIYI